MMRESDSSILSGSGVQRARNAASVSETKSKLFRASSGSAPLQRSASESRWVPQKNSG